MTVDTTKLRELAQKATPGPWLLRLFSDNTVVSQDKRRGEYRELLLMARLPRERHVSNAAFIAAANPSTVLALLDMLDGTESMFLAACADLGAIKKLLGLDPDDGGAEPILYEVKRLLAIEAAARNLAKVMLNARVYRWQ